MLIRLPSLLQQATYDVKATLADTHGEPECPTGLYSNRPLITFTSDKK